MKAVHRVRQTGQASIERTCNCFDMHRDAYYKYQMRYQQRKTVESKVIELVNRERIEQPRTGTQKAL